MTKGDSNEWRLPKMCINLGTLGKSASGRTGGVSTQPTRTRMPWDARSVPLSFWQGWLMMAAALGHVWNPKECGDGSKPYYYHIWKNQHPLTSYFRYHPGARVLTHNHVEDLPQPTLAGFEAGSFGAFIDPLGPRTFTTLATANHANGLVVHHWPGAPDHWKTL